MDRPITLGDITAQHEAQAGAKNFGRFIAALVAHKGSPDAAERALIGRPSSNSSAVQRDFQRLVEKANVAATTGANSPALVADPTSLERQFLNFIRPREVIGRLTGARRVPAGTPILAQATGTTAGWRRQGKAIKLSRGSFTRTVLQTLSLGALSVISQEIAKSPDDAAVQLITRDLAAAVRLRCDASFLDWTNAGIADVEPAGVAYGGTVFQAENTIRDDINLLMEHVAGDNWENLALIMSPRLSLYIAQAFELNTLGVNGGRLWGVPVIVSSASPIQEVTAGTLESITAINQDELFISEADAIDIETSQNAALEMDDSPSMDGTTPTESNLVSLFAINAMAVKVTRSITWRMRVPGVGVAVLTDIAAAA